VPQQYKTSGVGAGGAGGTSSPVTSVIEQADYYLNKVSGGTIPIPLFAFYLTLAKANYQPYSGMQPFTTFFSAIQSTVLMAVAINIVVGMLINLINAVSLPIILPLGILMRSFSITRKFGGTLIAIAFCLYFFFPLSIAMTKVVYDSVPKVSEPKVDILSIPLDAMNAFDPNYRVHGIDIVAPFSPFIQAGINLPNVMQGAQGNLKSQITQSITSGNVYGFYCYPIKLSADLLALTPFTAPLSAAARVAWIACQPVQFVHIVNDAVEQFKNIWQFIAGYLGTQIAAEAVSPVALFVLTLKTNDMATQNVVDLIAAYVPYAVSYSAPIILMPIIILIIVVTSIRSISPAIGGEAQVLGVSELM